jgi:hypothetical protein
MHQRVPSSIVLRLLAALMLLVGATASPAAAKLHHHHHTGSHDHGGQGAIRSSGSDATGDAGTNGTQIKQDGKGDGKTGTGALAPSPRDANTTEVKTPNGPTLDDDHSGKSADHSSKSDHPSGTDDHGNQPVGPKDNPIDTSITIVGRPRPVHGANAQGWKGFKIAHRLSKLPGAAKTWTWAQKNTIFGRSRTFTKSAARNRIIRNAIGQPFNKVVADRKGQFVGKDDRSAGAGIHGPIGLPATGGIGDVASLPHHKPIDPPAWSPGRPHDPPASATPYRTALDGRSVIRSGTGTAAIGGAANLNSGVLSGSSFHPKPR